MEISDLQIRDYVAFYTEEYGYHSGYVCCIYNSSVGVMYGDNFELSVMLSIEDIRPISLTKDALIKVGFCQDNAYEFDDMPYGTPMKYNPRYVYNGTEIIVKFPTTINEKGLITCSGDNIHITYTFDKISVHEFQHILRMCDIHDLVNKL